MVKSYALIVRQLVLCLSLLILGTGCGVAAQGHVNSADEVLLDHAAGTLEMVGPNASYWERVDFKQQSEESSPLRGGVLPNGVLPEGEAGKVVANDIPLLALESLTRCTSLNARHLRPIRYTMNINVYVRKNGAAVSGYVASSTLSDRDTMVCLLGALRATVWPMGAMVVSKALIAQPAPVQPLPDVGDRPSGIYPKQPSPGSQPQGEPGGFRIPFVGVIRFAAPALVGGLVFITITLLPQETAPHWLDELNPITRRPYVSLEEYQGVSRLPPEEIQRLQQIRAGKSDAPPAPAPSPQAQAQPAPQKQQDPKCDKYAEKIKEIIEAKRNQPPKNGYPQGRKGLQERWREIAVNEGKWGYKPDGSLGDKLNGHMNEYKREQEELIGELKKWNKGLCSQKGYTLPRNALQYAAQKPEIGPGKPVEPAPTPIWSPPPTPAVIAPKPQKLSK